MQWFSLSASWRFHDHHNNHIDKNYFLLGDNQSKKEKELLQNCCARERRGVLFCDFMCDANAMPQAFLLFYIPAPQFHFHKHTPPPPTRTHVRPFIIACSICKAKQYNDNMGKHEIVRHSLYRNRHHLSCCLVQIEWVMVLSWTRQAVVTTRFFHTKKA